jgi:tRNA (guanine-N7-)-methyltransferase
MPILQTNQTVPDFSLVQTAMERTRRVQAKYEQYWGVRRGVGLTAEKLQGFEEVWLEVGAGSGDFFLKTARLRPRTLCIAIERDKMRGKALLRRGKRAALPNLLAYRGNVVPTLTAEVPPGSLDRIFILYPCPWPKNSQRKNRWYNHPVMAHMVRSLKPGGRMVWASDQKFYIDEARFACERYHGLKVLAHGPVAPRPDNGLEAMSPGRTKFEITFLASGQPCFELIVEKN